MLQRFVRSFKRDTMSAIERIPARRAAIAEFRTAALALPADQAKRKSALA